MANSPLVSVRIPPEILERIDQLAQELYPSRRAGKNPNRSQVILDAIALFLEQHESSSTSTLDINEQLDDQQIQKALDEPLDDEPINIALQKYSKYMEHPTQYPQPIELPTREYIDWWFNYFSYMKKLTDMWFGVKS
ncbi:ribbon-helix-helix domain-containing protein [Chlorogloeopsis sp. ULAP01]|uniref:ribbon-helix-helix domain-containing protein n=1 Tax=Chlorogloeopsis sp. ULAP01 TaxID=3056483 RepID=UPI0025AB2A6A|nr:ribbon-helix-helix domain-containing protein [Chlorogloeopsis sp. ULAP01]MDM9380377.1 ribbon-helix-helix domain-containing protein [Chlorogloeopsis sp. ULAP01]